MQFVFKIDALGEIRFMISQPILNPEQTAWVCPIEWSGVEHRSIKIYGATSVQSLELALAFMRSELKAVASGKPITQFGAPFF